jgi:hypothetical protein
MAHANPSSASSEEEPRRMAPLRRPRHAVLGLYVVHGLVGVELTEDEEPWDRHGYVAVVQRGRLQRVQHRGLTRAPFGQIEAFWSYLLRNLRSKGGIRPARFNLYLAEFVWRYNHRKLTNAEQVQELFKLISEPVRWNERDYRPPEKMRSMSPHSPADRH